jgi:hypothetical protein
MSYHLVKVKTNPINIFFSEITHIVSVVFFVILLFLPASLIGLQADIGLTCLRTYWPNLSEKTQELTQTFAYFTQTFSLDAHFTLKSLYRILGCYSQ